VRPVSRTLYERVDPRPLSTNRGVTFTDPYGLDPDCRNPKTLHEAMYCVGYRLDKFDELVNAIWSAEMLILPMGEGAGAISKLGLGGRGAAEASAALGIGEKVAERVVTQGGALRTAEGVARQLNGARSYIPSLAIQETIRGGVRTADPQGAPGRFMYRIGVQFTTRLTSGKIKVTRGTLEVLVNETNNVIEHVLYKSR